MKVAPEGAQHRPRVWARRWGRGMRRATLFLQRSEQAPEGKGEDYPLQVVLVDHACPGVDAKHHPKPLPTAKASRWRHHPVDELAGGMRSQADTGHPCHGEDQPRQCPPVEAGRCGRTPPVGPHDR